MAVAKRQRKGKAHGNGTKENPRKKRKKKIHGLE